MVARFLRIASPIKIVLVFSALAMGREAVGAEGGTATKENLDLPFDAVEGDGDDEDDEGTPEFIGFYGSQYEGDGFFFCCDRSNSMEGGQWKRLQMEVVKNITQFSEKVQFAIVFFDSGMVKFPPSGRPAEANQVMKDAAIAMVMSAGVGHGTCGKPAMIATLQYANRSTAKRKTAIFLSDGPQTCDGQDSNVYQASMLSEIGARNTQKVRINTILIGNEGIDEGFMRTLAAMNRGTYRRIR